MSVSVTMVRMLVEEIERIGVDGGAYLQSAGISRALLDDANARVDLATYDRLHADALALTGDPALGLHLAERAHLASFHLVGLLSVHSPTLRHALEAFTRYRRLLSETEDPVLEEVGDEATLTVAFVRSGDPDVDRLRAELNVTSLVRVAHQFLGVAQLPSEVAFEHAAPSYADEVTRVFGCPVVYGAAATRIRFPRALLESGHLHKNDDLFQTLAARADRLLEGLGEGSGLAARVRLALQRLTLAGKPTMDAVARSLGTSARSLRRRLREEGSSYAEVVEVATAQLARDLLRDRSASIDAVAQRLGFSEPSAFYRAFKRWTGLTPRQWQSRAAPALDEERAPTGSVTPTNDDS